MENLTNESYFHICIFCGEKISFIMACHSFLLLMAIILYVLLLLNSCIQFRFSWMCFDAFSVIWNIYLYTGTLWLKKSWMDAVLPVPSCVEYTDGHESYSFMLEETSTWKCLLFFSSWLDKVHRSLLILLLAPLIAWSIHPASCSDSEEKVSCYLWRNTRKDWRWWRSTTMPTRS